MQTVTNGNPYAAFRVKDHLDNEGCFGLLKLDNVTHAWNNTPMALLQITDDDTLRRVQSGCPASNPATEMSSSSASQCSPFLLSSTCARCAGAAFSRRGNQANGAAMVRPSDRLTQSVSSSKRTDLGEIVIPCSFNECLIAEDGIPQFTQCTRIKTIAVSKVNRWSEPEFRNPICSTHVNVHKFTGISLVGVEKETEGFVTKNN